MDSNTPEFYGDSELPVQDELSSLKERATLMGIAFHPSIGVDKLREKIAERLKGESAQTNEVTTAAAEDENARRLRLKREAAKLIRINVTCMNPFKREWPGEIIAAGNSVVGTYKKYVPFNTTDGWHVPQIIYEQLKQRQCQVFVTERVGPGGIKVRKGKLINEFAIEVLPALTEKELRELARRQAVASNTAE